ncbi:MAG: phospholipid/cholesterol/gamma-HCH transport system ATP-binding protein [Pseudonocardiales bacterium]|jgi:phospholipid/cholesterol/gamma-HCH transport system ATP-binding protein|uniref:ABC transporter ATP-binding protein n=1 Tax=Pseudonocardia sp. TaxID=60912 RepID=UPI002614F754|nr:ABC transporter ATP-binding protein [Pseudonocardia sp.]MCW2720787.1 transporter related protein [Pseudonocardia sp.]MDT7617648.1 phospholipid/cholesterol/gamma-HCH transport system ATP-binding protein [Pseudonocardiales bacterium]MDT7704451.1 phospholipid/cholesterol/gamma-HCH transport system ATP-binding protein [Pseudonocardiales bacterium]
MTARPSYPLSSYDDSPTTVIPRTSTSGAHAVVDTKPHTMEVSGVHKAFGSFKVLQGLDLQFADDAITTVLGPSGTGKSVLIKHLVGLLEPDAGEVTVFGQDIWKLSENQRYDIRKRMGVLFQDGALFGSMNIFDNTAFPLRKHTDKSEEEIREIVMARCTEVGLERSLHKFPNEVSGGMRKRAGFARAMVLNPEIVFFDEPDSGLDPVRTSLLNDLILQMHAEHGGTYLLVTHDIRTARKVSDYVGLIWKGKVVHYGEADEAFASDDPFVRQFLAGDSAGPLGME